MYDILCMICYVCVYVCDADVEYICLSSESHSIAPRNAAELYCLNEQMYVMLCCYVMNAMYVVCYVCRRIIYAF